jgi:hypothetical protein
MKRSYDVFIEVLSRREELRVGKTGCSRYLRTPAKPQISTETESFWVDAAAWNGYLYVARSVPQWFLQRPASQGNAGTSSFVPVAGTTPIRKVCFLNGWQSMETPLQDVVYLIASRIFHQERNRAGIVQLENIEISARKYNVNTTAIVNSSDNGNTTAIIIITDVATDIRCYRLGF